MATPHDAPPKYLFMLTVYLDESGQESPEHVVIAGFVGTDEQWKSFIPDWQAALGPQRQSLHMCELRWNKPRIEGLLARLGPIPRKHGLIPVVGAVRVSDYSDMLTNDAQAILMSGYNLALYPVLIDVLQSFPETERIKWVFEEQPDHEVRARSTIEKFTAFQCQQRLSGIEFAPKHSTILTQPADYLAYATIQRLRDPDSKRAKWCSPILQGDKRLGKIVDRETIRSIANFVVSNAERATFLDTGGTSAEVSLRYGGKRQIHEALRRVAKKKAGGAA
jgi:Protein of unknown function (DUF3800)